MLQEELLKNISTISQYFKSEKLNDDDKKNRKELSELITNNIKDILYELYFEGFLLGTVETWGYKKNKLTILQWLMAQMAYIGPMLGQHHQFHHYNSGKSKFGEERYFRISRVIYKDLDRRLSKSKFLAGSKYSIADIATFPWIARHEWHDIGLKKHKHLTRWYKEIAKRKAVIKGYDFMNRGEAVPKV